ncbi:MAG: tetratricopeptide repeat protein [Paraprevotella sp.]|uniref:O-antigen ligase family protein n=1 Tax=Paraprevotella sp. TaxID=2049036 RepID=UPI00257B7AA8|nr:tetratricopeptide repeat protein [Paraprevotella sp.]MBS4807380.1 tetratricopeptide repeat protein [Paraprevotella sp.]
MNKEQYTYIIRYGVAAAAVAALCAPVVWRTEATPSVSDVWGYRAVAALAVLALTAVCLGRRLPRLHWADGVALFWWVCVSLNYVFVSPYPAAEVYGKAMALGVAYVALRLVIPFCGRAFTRLWWVGLCAAGGYELWTGFMQLAGREVSRHHLFDVTGTFFNPGPYAIFVAVVLAVSVAWWYRRGEDCAGRGRWSRAGAWSVAAVAVFCFPVLVATWSRTAWVAVAVAAACLLWKAHRRMVLWGMGVAVCAGVAAYFLKQGSADGRLLMTMVAGRAWAGEWLCGHGLGGYAQAYGAAQEAFFAAHPGSPLSVVAGSPEYAFNGVLGVGVEQGVLGAVPALVLGLWSLTVLCRRGEVSAYGWLVLLVSSLFSYPFALWPFLSLAVAWVALAASLEAGTAEVRWWKRTAVWPVVAVGGLCVWHLSACTARRVEAYEEFRRVRGIQDVAFLEDYRKKYEDLKAYPDFMFTFGSALREAGRYNESNAMLRQGTRVSCDPVFYTLMGNNYRDLGAVAEAESAYRKAFGMLPGRMYPLYRLMKLYEAEGQVHEAEEMARQIAAFRPKVDSPAMREMKNEAKEFLKKIK